MKKLFLALLMLMNVYAADEVGEKELPDQYRLALGAYFTGDFTSSVDIASKNGVSVDLDLQKMFNMDTDIASFTASGYYRFNSKHRIELGWKNTRSSGASTTSFSLGEGNFIPDINISSGVQSHFNLSDLSLMYTYSFYHTKDLEVGISAGLHYAIFGLGFGAVIEDFGGDFEVSLAQGLPVIGTRLEYHINPRWSVLYSFDIFALSASLNIEQNEDGTTPQFLVDHFTGFSGYMSDFYLSTEYRIFDNFSVGTSFNYALQDFSMELDADYDIGINDSVLGLAVYGVVHF